MLWVSATVAHGVCGARCARKVTEGSYLTFCYSRLQYHTSFVDLHCKPDISESEISLSPGRKGRAHQKAQRTAHAQAHSQDYRQVRSCTTLFNLDRTELSYAPCSCRTRALPATMPHGCGRKLHLWRPGASSYIQSQWRIAAVTPDSHVAPFTPAEARGSGRRAEP